MWQSWLLTEQAKTGLSFTGLTWLGRSDGWMSGKRENFVGKRLVSYKTFSLLQQGQSVKLKTLKMCLLNCSTEIWPYLNPMHLGKILKRLPVSPLPFWANVSQKMVTTCSCPQRRGEKPYLKHKAWFISGLLMSSHTNSSSSCMRTWRHIFLAVDTHIIQNFGVCEFSRPEFPIATGKRTV